MQEEVSAVCEGYRAKTNPKIIVVPTPWKPIDFFYDIDNNPNSVFKKLYLDYTVGLNKIYNVEEIEKERSQSYFQREFMLAYSIGTGNVFSEQSIINASDLGKQYYQNRLKLNFAGTPKSMGIDPGFASSKTAFTIIVHVHDNVIHVIYSKQFENSSTEKIVSLAWNLIKEFKLNDSISRVFADASQPGFIRSILAALGEFQNYEVWVEKSKRDNIPLYKLMHVVPVSFTGEKHKLMLGNCKKLLDKGMIAMDPDVHKDLIQELRLASADESMSLDKSEFSFDLLDSFRLSLEFEVLINLRNNAKS